MITKTLLSLLPKKPLSLPLSFQHGPLLPPPPPPPQLWTWSPLILQPPLLTLWVRFLSLSVSVGWFSLYPFWFSAIWSMPSWYFCEFNLFNSFFGWLLRTFFDLQLFDKYPVGFFFFFFCEFIVLTLNSDYPSLSFSASALFLHTNFDWRLFEQYPFAIFG